ncbi:DUF3288 family protein [Oculatella sp. FACHB-28]|uniref:DUF3288 family protein n=1 Tax=Cyanophyceae TaxID=3028117 RepID=UPI0016874E37|nr:MULTISPECIES: DUF3288 family protein [Cyanophyceae]MBD1870611.1 DUF3288 family protein [Cyanobacteria bacterium FACHB-471]MBD1995494.1 DUF3288 family protein [Leptolyngbya sp. FACHB-541]MBD2056159.1 DUF3288 family protein [Oculatella sp. FACHB-28]MBD2071916.1 DUF3288 family protein [Leptolyngbya sp. FACHB-671]
MASSNDSTSASKDQQHPLYKSDRDIINSLLAGEPNDYNLVELARLRIRYRGFPGARDIQADLEKVLEQWQLSETALYEKTRQIHQIAKVYKGRGSQREDWS